MSERRSQRHGSGNLKGPVDRKGGLTNHAEEENDHELVTSERVEVRNVQQEGRDEVERDGRNGRSDRGLVPKDVAQDLL